MLNHDLSLWFPYRIDFPDLFTYYSYLYYPTFIATDLRQVSNQVQMRCVSSVDQDGSMFSILSSYSLLAGILIRSGQINNWLLMPQWFISDNRRCHPYWTTMAFRNTQSYTRNKLVSNNRHIRARSTKWTYMNQPLFQLHCLPLGE